MTTYLRPMGYGSVNVYCGDDDKEQTSRQLKDWGYCYTAQKVNGRWEFTIGVTVDFMDRRVAAA